MADKILKIKLEVDTTEGKKLTKIIEEQTNSTNLLLKLEAQRLSATTKQISELDRFKNSVDKINSAVLSGKLNETFGFAASNASLASLNKNLEKTKIELDAINNKTLGINLGGLNSAKASSNSSRVIQNTFAPSSAFGEIQANQINKITSAIQSNTTVQKVNSTAVEENVIHQQNLAIRIGEIIGIYRVYNFAINTLINTLKAIPAIGIQLQTTQAVLEATTGSAAGMASVMSFLTSEANRTGISLIAIRENFRNFQASTSLAGESLETTARIFTNINTVIAGLHLPAEKAVGIFNALAQIFNKSKVQSEELVKQLGNLLPGAFASFQKANADVFKNTQDLISKMRQGVVFAHTTVDNFAQFLANRFQVAFVIASQGLNANLGRMQTSFTLLGESIFNLTSGPMLSFVKSATSLANFLKDTTTGVNNFGEVLKFGLEIAIVTTVGSLLKMSSALFTVSTAMGTFTGVAALTTRGMGLLSASFAFLSSPGFIIAGLASIALHLRNIGANADDARERIDKMLADAGKPVIVNSPEIELKIKVDNAESVKSVLNDIKEAKDLIGRTKSEIQATPFSLFGKDLNKQLAADEARLKKVQELLPKVREAELAKIELAKLEEAKNTNISGLDANISAKQAAKIQKDLFKDLERDSKNATREIQADLKQLNFSYGENLVSISTFFEKKKELQLKDIEQQLLTADESKKIASKAGDLAKVEQFSDKIQDLIRQSQDIQTEADNEKFKALEQYNQKLQEIRASSLDISGQKDEANLIRTNIRFLNDEKLARINGNKEAEKQLVIAKQHTIAEGIVANLLEKEERQQSILAAKENSIHIARQTNIINQQQAATQILQARVALLDIEDQVIDRLQEQVNLNREDIILADKLADAKARQEARLASTQGASQRVIQEGANPEFSFVAKNQQDIFDLTIERDTKLAELKKNRTLKTEEELNVLRQEANEKFFKGSLAANLQFHKGVFTSGAATFEGLTALSTKMFGAQSKEARASFIAFKAFSIAKAIIGTSLAVISGLQNTFPLNVVMPALAAAAGAVEIATISTQQPPAAHGGLDFVPKEQTFLLDKGERVLSPRQNKDLTGALANGNIGNPKPPVVNIRNINVLDPSIVGDYLSTREGEENIMNIVKRNQAA